MEKTEQLLYAYIKCSSEACLILSRLRGEEIYDIDVQCALVEVLKVKEPLALLFKDLTTDKIVELVKKFNFVKFHPEILAEIDLKESVIPKGVPRLLTEATVKTRGEQWRIHKNDADPFPSNPHAICLGDGLKLDLNNGSLYRKTQNVGRIKKKDLLAIRKEAEIKGIYLAACTFKT